MEYEERAIKFKEIPAWESQQTIVKVLKKVKYKFEPVSDYENTQFVCITQQENYSPIKDTFRKFGLKAKKTYTSCPLALTVCGMYKTQPLLEPIVFTQEDVLRIIKDVPENYIGEEIL